MALLHILPYCLVRLGGPAHGTGTLGDNPDTRAIGSYSRSLDFLVTTFGPWFWFLIAYSYVLLLIGSLLLIHMAATSPDVYRKQAIAIVAGAALPWAGTAVYLSDILSWRLNLTPFTLVGSDVVMGWAMFRFNLLDIVPIAQGTLVKDMSDGVIVLDDDDRIVNLNPAAERIIGQGRSRAVGRPITSLYEHASIFTGTSTSGTTQFDRSLPVDGSPMHFSITVSPVSTKRGELTGRLIVLHDVTEMRRTGEELERYRDQLEDLVERRTAELQTSNEHLEGALRKLRATQDQIVRQNRLNVLGLMANGIAHDLNNTLSPILGYTDSLLTSPENLEDRAETIKKMETVKLAAQDAAQVIARMRQFYKLREDDGRIEASTWTFSLSRVSN